MTIGTTTKRKRLLLVGWDSADWKVIQPLLDRGEMPMLAKLMQQGVHGNLRTLEPALSPMLWTSVATGKHAYDHGVCGFTEVAPGTQQIVPVSAATRKCRTLWQMLSAHGFETNLVSWFATQGERDPNVHLVSNAYAHAPLKPLNDLDWPSPPPGTYWPQDMAKELDSLRMHPMELNGDVIRMFVPRAEEVDQDKDTRIYNLATNLAEAFSVQNAATWLMKNKPWDMTAVYFRTIDEISHEFMPYHPPRMEGVPERGFELFKDVVNSTYRFHDLLLTNLIAQAGEDTAVILVSDHGFHSDHLRPRFIPMVPAGIVAWHREYGIFLAAGEGIQAGEEVHGARLLDVTPTVLRWFGLPRGKDMEGRVLNEIFDGVSEVPEIATWETTRGAGAPAPARMDEKESRELIEQFVALGYIEALANDPHEAVVVTNRENKWHLARAYMDGGRAEQALPLFEDVFHETPNRVDFAQRLAHCQLQLDLFEEAEATISGTLKAITTPMAALLIRANIACGRGDFRLSSHLLKQACELEPANPNIFEPLTRTYLKLRRWDDCEAAARALLKHDPNHAFAWIAIARCHIHRRDFPAAAEAALEAIGLEFHNAYGHLNLGIALAGQDRWDEAVKAFRNAITIAPGITPPYRFLAQVLRQRGDIRAADDCLHQAQMNRWKINHEIRRRNETLRTEVATRTAARREHDLKDPKAEPVTKKPKPIEPANFIIVSGLPRSGTSVMMQMLAAGGLPPMIDGIRQASEDNPEGFFEWEEIKQLARKPEILDEARGKAIKVISALLPHLPSQHRYQVIFMRRPVTEIARSQQRMIERAGKSPAADLPQMEQNLQHHADSMVKLLSSASQVKFIEVHYPELIGDPAATAQRVAEFLGKELIPHPEAMSGAVKPALHRVRPTT